MNKLQKYLFIARNIDSMSVTELAQSAGVTRPTLYAMLKDIEDVNISDIENIGTYKKGLTERSMTKYEKVTIAMSEDIDEIVDMTPKELGQKYEGINPSYAVMIRDILLSIGTDINGHGTYVYYIYKSDDQPKHITAASQMNLEWEQLKGMELRYEELGRRFNIDKSYAGTIFKIVKLLHDQKLSPKFYGHIRRVLFKEL